MQGTFDEASLRLARALQRPPEHVEEALQHVGVDAPYLARALVDGDPQGAIDAVSARLGVPQRDLILALIRSSGAETDPRRISEVLRGPAPGAAGAPPTPQAEAVHEFVATRLPALLSRAAAVSLLLGLGLGAFASLALWQPELFRALLVYAAAMLVGLASLALVAGAWRMHRAARVLRRMRDAAPAAKR